MRQVITLLFFFWSFSFVAHAHLGGSIAGTMLDSRNQQPLPNVLVTLQKPVKRVSTNVLGKYRFDNLPTGTCLVAISHKGIDVMHLVLR